MVDKVGSVQRSFRLSRDTSTLLDQLAEATNESRNALADRLLGEALRTERHPLIGFRIGAAGRREPYLVGNRLLVRQLVATVKAHDGNIEDAAGYLNVSQRLLRAALSYFAEFAREIDTDTMWAARVEAEERARWEREQATIA